MDFKSHYLIWFLSCTGLQIFTQSNHLLKNCYPSTDTELSPFQNSTTKIAGLQMHVATPGLLGSRYQLHRQLFPYHNMESFKGLGLDPYGFYLVILPLDISWALIKYHIKPYDRNIWFSPRPLWVWFVLYPSRLCDHFQRYDIELRDMLKKPTNF